MNGEELLNKICEATDLPPGLIKNELYELISQKGFEAQKINLEELRTLLAEYLQDVILKAKSKHSKPDNL